MSSAPSALVERPTGRRGGVSVARALKSATRAGIYAHLQETGTALTVRDVAAEFELHPNVARTHLETLADAGLVGVGLRKHPGGGRPAKLYQADPDGAGAAEAAQPTSTAAQPGASLLVRLLSGLLDDPTGRTGAPAPLPNRAHDAAAGEGRRLVIARAREERDAGTRQAGGGTDAGTDEDGAAGEDEGRRSFEEVAQTAIRALRPHAPEARVLKAGRDWVDVAGLAGTFRLLGESRPELAEALERGLLCGALAAAGAPVTLADAGQVPDGGAVWRARAAAAPGGRPAVQPVDSVDARGQQREGGVVQAMRAVTRLSAGEVLEVLTEGPGSPAAFARWADRAGHQLLGVERATDAGGRPAIRLLIRKGA